MGAAIVAEIQRLAAAMVAEVQRPVVLVVVVRPTAVALPTAVTNLDPIFSAAGGSQGPPVLRQGLTSEFALFVQSSTPCNSFSLNVFNKLKRFVSGISFWKLAKDPTALW